MVTRFYFPSGGGSPVNPPFHSSWSKTENAFRLPLIPSTWSPTQTPRQWLTNNENAMADPYYVLIASAVSPPLDGAALSGTFDVVIPAYESSTNANIYLMVKIKVVSRDGNTVRGTLYDGAAMATEVPGNASSAGATRILSAAAVSSLDPDPGDRIVVEIGFETDHTAGSNTLFTAGVGLGDSSALTDYALTSGTAAGTGRAWIEFSQTLTFLEEAGWIDATVERKTASVASHGAQTWTIGVLAPVEVQSYECDIAAAGTYIFSINGVDQDTVVVGAPTNGVMFDCSTPVALSRGTAVLKVRRSSGTSSWYYNNLGTYSVTLGEQIQGEGAEAVAWGLWDEHIAGGGAAGAPAGTLTVRRSVKSRSLAISSSALSGGNFAAETWTISLVGAQELYALVTPVRAIAGAWELLVDGTQVATATPIVATPNTDPEALVFIPASPVPLTAGSHTFKLRRVDLAVTRAFHLVGNTAVPTGTGSAYLTSWGAWSESTANMVAARVVFARPIPDEPENLTETHDQTSIHLFWEPPSAGIAPLYYEVRIDGGTPVNVGLDEDYEWTGLTPDTEYDLEVRSVVDGPSSWELLTVETDPIVPPGVPTNVAETHDHISITLTWDPPVTGDPVDHYFVYLDGFPDSTTTDEFFVFAGLNPGDTYLVQVMAVNDGGASALVGFSVTTDTGPPLDYYVTLRVQDLEWTGQYGEPTTFVLAGDPVPEFGPPYGPILPIVIGWQVQDPYQLGLGFPQQPRPTTARFSILFEDLALLQNVDPGDNGFGSKVEINIWPNATETDPEDRVAWFFGHVSSMRARPHKRGMVVEFIAVDDTADGPKAEPALTGIDWGGAFVDPLVDRLGRIDDALHIDLSQMFPTLDGVTAETRTEFVTIPAGQDPTVLDYNLALRFLSQATILWDHGVGNERLGKPILVPANGDETYRLRIISLPQYPKETRIISGDVIPTAAVSWGRTKGGEKIQYLLIRGANGTQGTIYDDDGAIIEVTAGDIEVGSDTFVDLSMFIADTWALDEDDFKWAPDPMRILGYLDPATVKGFFDFDAQRIKIEITDVLAPWQPQDSTVTGMLAGATFTLPAGGRYYTDVQLRRRVHVHPTE